MNLDDLNTPFAIGHRRYKRLNETNRPSGVPNGTQIPSRRVSPGESPSHYQSQRYSRPLAGPSPTLDGQQVGQTRDFYRKPRSRLNSPGIQEGSSTSSPSSSSGGRSTLSPSPPLDLIASESEQDLFPPQPSTQLPSHGLDALSEIRPQADYSFREADLFYGIPVDDASTQDALDSAGAGHTPCDSAAKNMGAESATKTTSWRLTFYTTWTKRLFTRAPPEPKEEGFQVIRPGNAALRMARMQQAQANAHAIDLNQAPDQNSNASGDGVSRDVRTHGSASP